MFNMDDNFQNQTQDQPQNLAQPAQSMQQAQPVQPAQPTADPVDMDAFSVDEQALFAESTNVQPTATDGRMDDISTDEEIANMSNEEIIENFARGLLIEKNLGEMDENTEKDMINDLIERVNAFIDRAVLESLPKEKLDELDNMIDNDTATPEAVAQLIQSSGIDANTISVEAMAKFREVYLGSGAEQGA